MGFLLVALKGPASYTDQCLLVGHELTYRARMKAPARRPAQAASRRVFTARAYQGADRGLKNARTAWIVVA
jgi:hypothetical protein